MDTESAAAGGPTDSNNPAGILAESPMVVKEYRSFMMYCPTESARCTRRMPSKSITGPSILYGVLRARCDSCPKNSMSLPCAHVVCMRVRGHGKIDAVEGRPRPGRPCARPSRLEAHFLHELDVPWTGTDAVERWSAPYPRQRRFAVLVRFLQPVKRAVAFAAGKVYAGH